MSNEVNFGFVSEDSVDAEMPQQQARAIDEGSDEWLTKDPINYKTYGKRREEPVKKLRKKFVPFRSAMVADESEITLTVPTTPGPRMSQKRKQSFPKDSTEPNQDKIIMSALTVRKPSNKNSIAAGTTGRSTNPSEAPTSSLRIDSAVSTAPLVTPDNKRETEIVTLRAENKSLKTMITTFLNEARDMQRSLRSWTDRFKKVVEFENVQESEIDTASPQQTLAEPTGSEAITTVTEAPPPAIEDLTLQMSKVTEAKQKEIKEVETAKSLPKPQPLQAPSTSVAPFQRQQSQPNSRSSKVQQLTPSNDQPGSRNRSPVVLNGALAGEPKKSFSSISTTLKPTKNAFKFPLLPISDLEVFTKFNEDLANRQYFVFASQAHQDRCLAAGKSSQSPIDILRNLIVTRHPKLRGGGSELMLMLKDLVSVDLLKKFVYDKKLDTTEERLELKCFTQFVEFFRVQSKQILKLHVLASLHFLQTRIPLPRELPTRMNPNPTPQPSTSASGKNVVIASKDDIDELLKKYFTEETVLESDASSVSDDDDDVQDVTPAPISIDIADESD